MERIIHMCVSIRGALRNMQGMRSNTKSYMDDDNGNPLTVGQAREALYDELAQGRKVLPMGKCDNFSYQEGCLGHEKKGNDG